MNKQHSSPKTNTKQYSDDLEFNKRRSKKQASKKRKHDEDIKFSKWR
jgi:hypothetical protein